MFLTLDGAMGADTLVGNGGADTFVFASAASAAPALFHSNASANIDTIFDFVSGEDMLEISASAFGGGLTLGSLAAGAFVAAPQAMPTTGSPTTRPTATSTSMPMATEQGHKS